MSWSITRSLTYAVRGVKVAFKTEKSFKVQTLIGLLVILAAWWKGMSELFWVILLLIIALILALEIFNSAVERLVDMLAPKTHGMAKEIKDLLAGMVLIVSLFAIAIGLIIFF